MYSEICTFLIIFGSINYWKSQKINNGDGFAFIGYTIFYSTTNLWIIIELYLYKKHRIQYNHSLSSTSNYRYDAVQSDLHFEQPNVVI